MLPADINKADDRRSIVENTISKFGELNVLVRSGHSGNEQRS